MARVATYSIAACDLDGGQWGVATQSKFLGVGSVVPWAVPQVGAIATQAYANPRYGPDGLDAAPRRAERRGGRRAAHLGRRRARPPPARRRRRQGRQRQLHRPECMDWAGGRTGPCYAAQGNILVSAETVDAIAETFERNRRRAARRAAARLPRRRAGRGRRPARPAVGGAARRRARRRLRGPLRQHRRPARRRPRAPARRSCAASTACTRRSSARHRRRTGSTSTTRSRGAARAPRQARLRGRARHDAFNAWAGKENLEERVDGVERIDPVVLEELRRQT